MATDLEIFDGPTAMSESRPGPLLNVSANNFSNFGADFDETELYQVPLGVVVMLSTFYGTISLAAVAGNGLVLWVVLFSRRMRTVTNFLLANLSLADIIIGLFAIPFQFQAALLQRWDLPEFMCAFCPFVQVLSVNVSVFTLAAIAVDRYRAVLKPLSARASKRKATIFIVIIWLISSILAFPMKLDFTFVEKRDKDGVKPFCDSVGLGDSVRKYYLLGLVILQYFLPLIIITGAYVRIATRLWGATAPGNAEDARDAAILRNKKRVIKMLTVVVLIFALCWLPLQSYNFLQSFIPAINNYQYINIIWFCFHWLAMSSSTYNPFVYSIYSDKFQREFRARLRCMNFCFRSRAGSPCSEVSDYDRSKIRGSYRFHDVRNQRRNGAEPNHNHACQQRRAVVAGPRARNKRNGSGPGHAVTFEGQGHSHGVTFEHDNFEVTEAVPLPSPPIQQQQGAGRVRNSHQLTVTVESDQHKVHTATVL